MTGVLRVAPDERVAGPLTPGMLREQAVATEGLWSGFVTTEPGVVSAWHHHSEHRTIVYMLSGRMRIEFGKEGSDAVEGGPGDFLLIPAAEIHRESNPGSEPSTAVVVRVGSGESVVNVDGPRT